MSRFAVALALLAITASAYDLDFADDVRTFVESTEHLKEIVKMVSAHSLAHTIIYTVKRLRNGRNAGRGERGGARENDRRVSTCRHRQQRDRRTYAGGQYYHGTAAGGGSRHGYVACTSSYPSRELCTQATPASTLA